MFKSRILAAAAALTLAGGVAVVATSGTAHAATPSCGSGCADIFSAQFGDTYATPQYLVDSFKQEQKAGSPVILFQESNTDPALDWTATDEGTTADFYDAGLIGSAVALHYGCVTGTGSYEFSSCPAQTSTDDPAFELQYAPFGAPTGMCAGVAATAVAGEQVTLQPCGQTARTVWIVDTLDGSDAPGGFATLRTDELPVINGSDDNFSQPFVLTYPGGSNPVDKPRAVLEVTNLSGYSNGIFPELSTISSNQLFGAVTGPVVP